MCAFFIYLTLPVRLLVAVAAAVINSTCQGAAAAGARQLLHAFLLFTWEPANSLYLTLALCVSCCYTARCSGYSAVNAPTRLTVPTVNSSAQTVLSDCLLRGWESAAYRRSVCFQCVCHCWALTAYAVEISHSSSVATTVGCRRVERMLRLFKNRPSVSRQISRSFYSHC